MKRVIKYLLLCLIVLIPFSASAIKTSNVKLNEVKDGYYCTLLMSDESASKYDVFYTPEEYGARTYNSDSVASKRPNPRCLDSTYSEKRDYLAGNNCFFDLYSTKVATESHKYLTYSGWNSKITDTSKYSSTPYDCMATSLLTDGQCSADKCKGYDRVLYIETKSNSEFYTEDEMKILKGIDYTFADDTKFCFASTIRTEMGYSEKVYFGHPIFYVDYYGIYEEGDDQFVDGKKDSNDRQIIDFSKYKTTTSDHVSGGTRHCNSYENGKICIDGFPYADDPIITFEELSKMSDYDKTWEAFIITDGKGIIKDAETCIGLAKQAGYEVTPYDSTNTDKDRTITDEDFAKKLLGGMTKKQAIKSCYNGDSTDGKYHCYRYTFLPTVHPMYNTTVWTTKQLSCGFEEVKDWDWEQCKKSSLDVLYKQCKTLETKDKDGNDIKSEYCKNITHSGYNGTPDFYDERKSEEKNIKCETLMPFHIIYRVVTIAAPILTLLFVTIDLISSVISGDPKKVAKFRSKLFRRIIALVLLIAIPVFIHILVSVFGRSSSVKDTSLLKCVILGNGTDKDENKSTNNSSSNNTVATASDAIPKDVSKLITEVIIDGVPYKVVDSETSNNSSDTDTYAVVEEEEEIGFWKSIFSKVSASITNIFKGNKSTDKIALTTDDEASDEDDDENTVDESEDPSMDNVNYDSDDNSADNPAEEADDEPDEESDDDLGDGSGDDTTESSELNASINGQEIDLNKDGDKESVEVAVTTVSNDVQIISGTGKQDLVEGENVINIVATVNGKSYDTVSLNIRRINITTSAYSFTPPPTTKGIKAIRKAAKKVKKYQKKHKMKWCSKRIGCKVRYKSGPNKGKCKKKYIKNPACKTKKVQYLLTKKNKQNRLSCASIVSTSLYIAKIYPADWINYANPNSKKPKARNVNGATSMAKLLVSRKWKPIYKRKNVRAGDVMFFRGKKSNPNKVTVDSSHTYGVGHVEIAANTKGTKTYNTGGHNAYKYKGATKCTRGDFLFALRYNGN